jgi:hypothetical protein
VLSSYSARRLLPALERWVYDEGLPSSDGIDGARRFNRCSPVVLAQFDNK